MPVAPPTADVSTPEPAGSDADPARARRAIVASWRALTGGSVTRDPDRPTLVACSGGADSVALALALSETPAPLVIGHVVHDLRPPEEAIGDRDAVRAFAERIGRRFVESSIRVADAGGNLEADARTGRYKALDRLAKDHGCGFIVTGHHADDQLETLLMRLIRGAGLRGLAGVRERLELEHSVVVRPMLGVRRADAEAICTDAGVAWRHDKTNDDLSILRAAIRAQVTPGLEALAPGASIRASRTAGALAEAGAVLDGLARAQVAAARRDGAALAWDRDALRGLNPVLIGETLRLGHESLAEGVGADSVSARTIRMVVRAIMEQSGGLKRFELAGIVVNVRANEIRMEKTNG